jgi:hypothetical protein
MSDIVDRLAGILDAAEQGVLTLDGHDVMTLSRAGAEIIELRE